MEKTHLIKLRVTPELKRQAQEKAEREGIALSEAIRRLLATWAKDPPPENEST